MTQGNDKLNIEPVENREETNQKRERVEKQRGKMDCPRLSKALGTEIAKVTEASRRLEGKSL